MRRKTRRLVAPALALALGAAVGTAEAVETSAGERQAVVLQVSIDGEVFDITAAVGASARVVDRTGAVHLLVPALGPSPEGAEPRIALEIYEPVRVNGADEPNLLEVVPLPGVGEGAVLVLSARRPMEVAVAGLREIPPSDGAGTPGGSLRPTECCIGCNGYIVCGLCVQAECGVCCVF